MTEPDSRPARESDTQELVWPPPVSADDIVWLDPLTTQPALDVADRAPEAPLATAVVTDATAAVIPATVPLAIAVSPATVAVPPAKAAVEGPRALPLSYCLFPEVAFEWHDAVAIVQQLAEQLTRGLRGDPAGSLPDIGNITIDPTGRLSATLEPTGAGRLARGLGYLLHQLLTDRDGPVALRLIVSQVVSDLPTIGSVEDLSRELTRWERPHRTEKLRHLYERLHPIASTRPQPLAPAPEVVEPRPETPVEETPPRQPAMLTIADAAQSMRAWLVSHQTVAVSVLAFASVVLVVAVGFILLPGPSRLPRSSKLPVVPPAIALTPPIAESLAPPTDYWLPGQITLARAPVGSASPPTPLDPTPVPRRSGDLVVAGFVAPPPREEPPPRTAPQTASQDPRPGPTPISTGVAADAPERIYTGRDPGVVEAVLVKPYLPEHPERGTPADSLGVLELVVNRAGAVESVRLYSPFNRYRERWWVYVAKNWTFQPALKDGQPVKSLKRIVITDVRPSEPQ